MKQHIISGAIAAAVASGIAAYSPPKITHQTVVVSSSKHAWPDLSDEQKTNLASALKGANLKVKLDIVCNDAGCSDLAADIDDACEDAGLDSALDKALGPLGYGIGVQVDPFDQKAADEVLAAIGTTTELRPQLVPGKSPAGVVTLLIGKHPREAK